MGPPHAPPKDLLDRVAVCSRLRAARDVLRTPRLGLYRVTLEGVKTDPQEAGWQLLGAGGRAAAVMSEAWVLTVRRMG